MAAGALADLVRCAAKGRPAPPTPVRRGARQGRAGVAAWRGRQRIYRRAVDAGAHRAGHRARDRRAPPPRPRLGDPSYRLGWSLQRPRRRAAERDQAAIDRWVAADWPRIKQTPIDATHAWSFSTSPV